ncbi:MinD/ParA family ATP-binding protein [Amycolatopsis sp. NBC_01480]|uniref:MinD/ParA family ATP-binding protein n=1 Tax=Amycolatopsis sp. NBC_01480 TaxID=2903562 RepID=UPI002E29DAEF|nr:carbon monoxide dehydrogenase maturation protein [Amycolatopsis sp. NBC_01480]
MLIALASLKGSPGVTTFAAALAARWPAQTRGLLVECDPAGGDLAMRFGLPAEPSLVSLAAATRRTGDPAVVWEHAHAMPGGASTIPAPMGGMQARAALYALVTGPHGLVLDQVARQPGVVVFADCGRLDAGSPAEAIARRADVLVLITGTYGDELAHVAARIHDLGRWARRSSLLLAGQGYPTPEVERELGIRAMGRIPHDPAAAAALAGRAVTSSRRRGSGGLARCAAAVARALATPVPGCAPAGQAPSPLPDTAGPPQIPGVPAQQVRFPGVPVTAPPAPRPPPGREPRRNGHHALSNPGRTLGDDHA